MSPQETARAILAWYGGDDARWTQQAFARDDNGASLPMDDLRTDGVCWCLSGAALVLNLDMREAAAALGFSSVLAMETWNDCDSRTFADVRERLERIAAEPTP